MGRIFDKTIKALNASMQMRQLKQNVINANIANAETTRTEDGGPYRKQTVILEADPTEAEQYFIFGQGGGKQLAKMSESMLLGQVPLVQGIRESGDEGKPVVTQIWCN